MRPNLRLLGGAAIEADGAVVSSPATQRHRLALLALLAASPRRTLSRDKLVGTLWPDHGQDDARHLLRQAVYVIRKELGESVLESAGEQITLDPDEFIKEAFGQDTNGRFFGGGRSMAGGFEIPIGFLSGSNESSEYTRLKWEVFDAQIKQKLFRLINPEDGVISSI